MPSNIITFTTIRTEGALLPPDVLQRIADGDTSLGGLTAESYHLSGQKINEAINQSWNTIQGAWANFKSAQERLPAGDIGTTITRERWLLPLFRELEYGRLQSAATTDFVIDDKNYPVSHKSPENAPIHLVSYQLDLDRRAPGMTGASSASPHSLVQVLLNRSEGHLWGFVSNGHKLRILRDNASLTRQAYVEFDLQAMMDGEVYSDFALLWLLCHQSRIENGRDCWLEGWVKAAREQGTRALDDLRNGVEKAITALGLGFLDHPANMALRDALEKGTLDKQDYYRQLLRLVYRLLFLFAAEDRGLLYDPTTPESARQLYSQHYSSQRLRRMAEKLKGTRHHDLFEALRLVMEILGGEKLFANEQTKSLRAYSLGLPVLGSFLFTDGAVADIIHAKIANVHLLDAIRALAFREDRAVHKLRPVDYKNLGAEELGSVYESLLELHPQINVSAKTFSLGTAGGNERKTTGSYYTPTSLINALLDSALDPVILEAITKPEPESALLNLKICDPACGSGHFLIAAAHRLARALAQVRTNEEEPAPAATRAALRDVIGHCIYGVDINPMAVELCKVNLWMEAIEPGKPLNFLDHRIQVGNSLLGTTPALMEKGIPDNAFNPIEGDEREDANWLKKLNRQERHDRETGQRSLFEMIEPPADYRAISVAVDQLDEIPDDTLAGLRRKEQAYADLAQNPERQKAQILADAWCAAFVWEKGIANKLPPMTDLQYRNLQRDALDPRFEAIRQYVESLKKQYQFFHWHVAFPDVFTVDTRALLGVAGQGLTGWEGGFDCVLGNPPWERIKIQEKEWFAERNPNIANVPNAATRKRLINDLLQGDPYLYAAFQADLRAAEGESHYVRVSGRYPLCGRGDVNTYTLFAESTRQVIGGSGRVGMIVPSGIATDDTTKYFFQDLMETGSLVSLYDFENRDAIFPGVHRSYKFCLLTMAGYSRSEKQAKLGAEFIFFAHQVDDLADTEKRFTLSAADIALLNPNTGTTAIFRNKRDTSIVKKVYENVPIIHLDANETNLWGLKISRLIDLNLAGELLFEAHQLEQSDFTLNHVRIYVRQNEEYLRLYEGKMINIYNHRLASTYTVSEGIRSGRAELTEASEYISPHFMVSPRYWVPSQEIQSKTHNLNFNWFLSYMDICSPTNERTMITCVIPYSAPSFSLRIITRVASTARELTALHANFASFVFDYIARQFVGGLHMSDHIVKQLPVIPPHTYTAELLDFIVPRVLELTYTAWDLQPFAQDVGYAGAPFIWDDERRFLLRCELDALYFHLYGITRDDAAYILDTFPIVKRKDEAAHGEYRTARVILEMYDQMAALPVMSVPAPKGEGKYPVPDVSQWQTWLNSPPADPSVAHERS